MVNFIQSALLITLSLACAGCTTWRPGDATLVRLAKENTTHEMHFGIARIAERNGNLEGAQKAYRQILQQDPGHVGALHRLAVSSVRQERLDEALDYFEQALQIGEPSAELLGDYGYALYLSLDSESATVALERALELDPQNQRVRNNLGLVLGRQGNYDDAFEQFQQSGERAAALSNLAFVQSQFGDLTYARQNYHEALDLDPTLSIAANGLFEIHKSFPTDQPALIKPFRAERSTPEQIVSRDAKATDIEDLILTIAESQDNSDAVALVGLKETNSERTEEHGPLNDASVVQASYQQPSTSERRERDQVKKPKTKAPDRPGTRENPFKSPEHPPAQKVIRAHAQPAAGRDGISTRLEQLLDSTSQ